MSVSVALCSYNGAAYIAEQLRSIAEQTLLPEELVICDDGSSDSTVAIIRAFASEAPFKVLLFQNEQKLGVARNFQKALSLCTGDIIAMSDQDDVWMPIKLEKLCGAF